MVTVTVEEAVAGGYVRITESYASHEERLFMRAVEQMAGANCVTAGRAVWRHKNEVIDHDKLRLRTFKTVK